MEKEQLRSNRMLLQSRPRYRFGLSIALIMSALLSQACAAQDISVENAWVRPGPPGAKALAGYMTIVNSSDSDVSITSVSSDAFETCMIHETVIEDGLARMRHHPELSLPAGGRVSLEPNGYHLMLMRPTRELIAGDEVELTLSTAAGSAVTAVVPVRNITR